MEKNQAQGQTPEQSAQEYNQLVAVRRQKLADLQQAGNDPFVLTKYPVDNYAGALKEKFSHLEPEQETGEVVCLAGRMMSKRVMGKASFARR